MDPRALAERADAARRKLQSAAMRLSDRLGIDGLEEIAWQDARDPNVKAMRELEVIANLVDHAARAVAPKKDKDKADEKSVPPATKGAPKEAPASQKG